MEPSVLAAQKAYWDDIFSRPFDSAPVRPNWIGESLARTQQYIAGNVLEIGCGRGHDTYHLLQAGCRVTCLDLSWPALQGVAHAYPTAHLVNAALPAPLPFVPAAFDFVVAGLSLHYFRWLDTCAIIGEIERVLRPGGTLIFRVNSTEDVAHGAGRGEEIEPNLYLYQGRYKRFFTEQMCRDLFTGPWQIELLTPRVETYFRQEKPTWIGVCRRILYP